jgi:hypothetical protein
MNKYVKLVEETLNEANNSSKWFSNITNKLDKKFGPKWVVDFKSKGHYDLVFNGETCWSSMGGYLKYFDAINEILDDRKNKQYMDKVVKEIKIIADKNAPSEPVVWNKLSLGNAKIQDVYPNHPSLRGK